MFCMDQTFYKSTLTHNTSKPFNLGLNYSSNDLLDNRPFKVFVLCFRQKKSSSNSKRKTKMLSMRSRWMKRKFGWRSNKQIKLQRKHTKNGNSSKHWEEKFACWNKKWVSKNCAEKNGRLSSSSCLCSINIVKKYFHFTSNKKKWGKKKKQNENIAFVFRFSLLFCDP